MFADFKFLKKDLETGELHYQVAFIVTSIGKCTNCLLTSDCPKWLFYAITCPDACLPGCTTLACTFVCDFFPLHMCVRIRSFAVVRGHFLPSHTTPACACVSGCHTSTHSSSSLLFCSSPHCPFSPSSHHFFPHLLTGHFEYTFRVGIIKLANATPPFNPSLSTSMYVRVLFRCHLFIARDPIFLFPSSPTLVASFHFFSLLLFFLIITFLFLLCEISGDLCEQAQGRPLLLPLAPITTTVTHQATEQYHYTTDHTVTISIVKMMW